MDLFHFLSANLAEENKVEHKLLKYALQNFKMQDVNSPGWNLSRNIRLLYNQSE